MYMFSRNVQNIKFLFFAKYFWIYYSSQGNPSKQKMIDEESCSVAILFSKKPFNPKLLNISRS